VIIHTGERFGHQKASYTLMKRLRELGFKGQFEILYEDLYPELAVAAKYTSYPADSLPGSSIKPMPQSIEVRHKLYFNKLASLMKQLLPRYKIQYDILSQIIKNTYMDPAAKINQIDAIILQFLNILQEDLKAAQNSFRAAHTNLVATFKQEFIKEKNMELLPTQVRLSCDLPTRGIVESTAKPNEKQLLEFIQAHKDSVSIQLVYGLKPLVVATAPCKNIGYNGKKLEVIFSGYIAPDIADEETRNQAVAIDHPVLGDLMITRLPSNRSEWHLDQIPLSFIAATDKLTPRNRPASTYMSDISVVTQPTNWKAQCFIDIYDQVRPILIEEQLCSFSYNNKQYCIDINDSAAIVAMCESQAFSGDSKLLQVLQAFKMAQQKQNEQSYRSRDIALFESMRFNDLRDIKSRHFEPTYNKTVYRDPLEQLQDLIAFYNANKISMKTPYVLLVPNFEKVFVNTPNEIILDILGNHVKIIKNIADINYNDDYIYIMLTGHLHPEVFDYLTTLPDMLPAIIEGCNSVELCEYTGTPFLLLGRNGNLVQKLFTEDENFDRVQNLHINASLYLSNGNEEKKQDYLDYMHLAISKPNELEQYCQQRKEIYKSTRTDVIDRSLQVITAIGIKTQDKAYEFRNAPAPRI
jgi:hypothetical protein